MYEKINISDFMEAWFEEKYEKLSKEDFKIVHAEYLDTSGLYMSDDFEKHSLVHHLNSKINYIKMFVRLQREFMDEFDMPFIRDFAHLKEEYGYVVKWNGSIEDFENQLVKIEKRQIKHQSFLEEKIKELKELKESRSNNHKKQPIEPESDLKKSRMSFIRMLNSLGKIGYKIDKLTTTVEELALMIKQQMEENDSVKVS